MTMKSLGQKIRELRMKKGITQTELAEGLVTPSMISQIESDKANPSFKLLEGISRKLDVSIDEFLLDMQSELEAETRYKLAKSLMDSTEYAKAITVLEGLLETDLDQNEVKHDLATAYTMAKEYDKSTKLLEAQLEAIALERDRSKAVQLQTRLGWVKIMQHDYVLAKHYLNHAVKELGKSQDVPNEQQGLLFHYMAITMRQLGEVTGAHDNFKKAIEMYQGSSSLKLLGQAYQGLAACFHALGDFRNALDTTRTAITMYRSVNDKYYELLAKVNYGIFLYELQQYEEAGTQFEECINAFQELGKMDDVANVYSEMGNLNLRMKNFKEAEKWCFRSLELLPAKHITRAYVYRSLGMIYQDVQNFDRALEYMLSSVEIFETFGLRPEASKCYSNIVSIYQARGELDKASDYMQKMTSSMEEELRARGLYL